MYYLTNKYCCTCLNTESTKLTDLTNLDSDSISFYEKLAVCVPNRISLDMKIQENFLCEDCSRNITQFYDFYNVCMKSKAILDNIGLKVQYFKVGDQNTVVNIIPNDYYLFNDTNVDNVDKIEEKATVEGNNDILCTDIPDKTNSTETVDKINDTEICSFTKKRKTHKTTSELVNSILKQKIIQDSSYTCNICQKKFNKKGLLIVHITLEHSNKKFYCQTCDKQFNDNDDYKTHMELHKSDKNKKHYTCNYCERIFTSNSALCRHKKIHTNDRRYACDICSVRYIQKAQIINHISKYHPGYVYEEKKCKTCRKVFETKNDLEIHNKINHELKFDLKTLKILQTTGGNIRNIIECVNAESNDDIIYSNVTDHSSHTNDICDKQNFVTNCDLIQYNTDIIENIDNVNIIDLDIIENGSIIEENIQNITKNKRFTDNIDEIIEKDVNNTQDEIIDEGVRIDNERDLNKNCDIEDNNINMRADLESSINIVNIENDIDTNENLDNNIDVNENIENIVVNGEIENININENIDNNIDIDENNDNNINMDMKICGNNGINIDTNENIDNKIVIEMKICGDISNSEKDTDLESNINLNGINKNKTIENSIDIIRNMEHNIDINETIESIIDTNEDVDNNIDIIGDIDMIIDNNISQNLIFSDSHENIESNDVIFKNELSNNINIPIATDNDKNNFNTKTRNKKFLYTLSRFNEIKKKCRKRKYSKQIFHTSKILKLRTKC